MLEQLYLTQWKFTAALSQHELSLHSAVRPGAGVCKPKNFANNVLGIYLYCCQQCSVTFLSIFSQSQPLNTGFAVVHYISNVIMYEKIFPLDQVTHDRAF